MDGSSILRQRRREKEKRVRAVEEKSRPIFMSDGNRKKSKKVVPEFNKHTGWYKDKVINMPLSKRGEENFDVVFPGAGKLNVMTEEERELVKAKYPEIIEEDGGER